MVLADLTPIERRLLAYLDQRGATDRRQIVCDLASPASKAGRGIQRGSNGAAPLIVGKWAKRLIKAGWVSTRYSDRYKDRRGRLTGGFYQAHAITPAGKAALREQQS